MLDLARLVYFFSWQWQCNFFSGIVEQIWPVYRAPPPPNLPSVKIGEGAPCTIFTEETGEKGSVHRLVKITLRESYGINGYALV